MTQASGRRVCIISQTYVTQEPRVLRQIRTFQERGWQITVAGHPGTLAVPDDWDFHDMTFRPPSAAGIATSDSYELGPSRKRDTAGDKHAVPSANGRLRALYRRLFGAATPVAAQDLAKAPKTPASEADATSEVAAASVLRQQLFDLDAPRALTLAEAKTIYFAEPEHSYFRDTLAQSIPCVDLVVAHDWHTLPLAEVLAERWNVEIVADIHEYAVEQYAYTPGSMEERYFRQISRPMIQRFHSEYFHRIRAISTVCDGISEQLKIDHHLLKKPAVARSTPFYSQQNFKITGETVEVLYHGLVNHTRHLEVGIESLALWRPEFTFVIRGPGPESYISKLKSLAEELGVASRVRFDGPVPFDALIPTAAQSDVGYLAFLNFSRQRQFASPNKFFEYIMAGLAVAVMDVQELTPVINRAGNGTLIDAFDPQSIANAINGLTRERIDLQKRNSLALARELCWEREQESMIAAYGLAELEEGLRAV